jgi:hypothetical protein
MTTSPKTFAYGTLEADTDSWLLAREDVIALDVGLLDSFDGSLAHQTVSVVGTMGIPSTAPGITKLIVKKLASHEAINRRAYEIYKSGQRGSAADHWLRAEHELLNM